MPRTRRVATVAPTALLPAGLAVGAAGTAEARFIPTDPVTSGSSNATLWVDDTAHVSRDGFTVTWTIKLQCPAGETYTGSAQVDERNPDAIPELFGEDAGISSRTSFSGTCTGHRQTIRLVMPVQDTTVNRNGTTVTLHEPIHPTPANDTNAAVQISGTDFFTQYCAAPACASTTGPYVRIR